MKTQIKIALLSVFALALATSSCYYDNEEDLYLGSSNCDTANVTYSASVAPIMAGYCNSCHSGTSPSGNVKTDSYSSVVANSIRIQGAVNHKSGFSPMPQGEAKLSSCSLSVIDIWIRKGMPEN